MDVKYENNREKIEEETLPYYNPLDFYPTRIGEILASKYKVVGKLGFGAKFHGLAGTRLRVRIMSLNVQAVVTADWCTREQSYVTLKINIERTILEGVN